MPSKKTPCPNCGRLKQPKAKLCRACTPPYERTTEHKAKMSEATSKPKPWLRGRKRPSHAAAMREWWDADPARRERLSERMKKMAEDPVWRQRIADAMTGEKNHRWLGGLSRTKYAPGFTRRLCRRIRKRDNHTCQLCALTEAEAGYNFSIHHADYDKGNHDEDNLFTTCKGCNSRVNTNRDEWSAYFAFVAHVRRETGKHVCDLLGRQVITQREGLIVRGPIDEANLDGIFRVFSS